MFKRRGTDNFPSLPAWIIGLWLGGIVVSLSVTGFVLWLLYRVVMHFTS